jgi:hypothetical protein
VNEHVGEGGHEDESRGAAQLRMADGAQARVARDEIQNRRSDLDEVTIARNNNPASVRLPRSSDLPERSSAGNRRLVSIQVPNAPAVDRFGPRQQPGSALRDTERKPYAA